MKEILRQFCPHASGDVSVSILGQGNINDTWLVRSPDRSFVLQRLNSQVFPHPHLIMANLSTFSRHLLEKGESCGQRWENSRLLSTCSGAPFYTDHQGHTWRAISYIDGTITHQAISTSAQARQVGWALGHFHYLLADLPAEKLHDTLPGFHVLPRYLQSFDQVLGQAATKGGVELRFCLDFVAARRLGADLLERARRQGKITVQVVHGDPKAANILFDAATDLAVSLIDLDTVGPGLLLSDIGDCLRSCCNVQGEEVKDVSAVEFDLGMFRAILAGYFSEAGSLLSAQERQLIFQAVRLIAFELGLRFLSDYLAGNNYFKVSHAEENLHRALVQFHLVQSIERQQGQIEGIIKELA
ncbi:MAG: aminoglycoside [Desulfobulbaceae bacterium]|nr:MAG: aminoglycoside [Desulfobulbaceae bacterium]